MQVESFMYIIADIDECLENDGGCNQICNNTAGSYQCLCHKGYFLTQDNKTCQGIAIILLHSSLYFILLLLRFDLMCNFVQLTSESPLKVLLIRRRRISV